MLNYDDISLTKTDKVDLNPTTEGYICKSLSNLGTKDDRATKQSRNDSESAVGKLFLDTDAQGKKQILEKICQIIIAEGYVAKLDIDEYIKYPNLIARIKFSALGFPYPEYEYQVVLDKRGSNPINLPDELDLTVIRLNLQRSIKEAMAVRADTEKRLGKTKHRAAVRFSVSRRSLMGK